ncbi:MULTISPECIES: Na+/H+ antiporter subunit E [Caloramator]|uniref:Multicomponent Na+:H+ antiporter subunit E n=1 Tax=Caloramator proteoclasticus DSM 10124 TaxID=1121262 RepID=A0A1M4TSE7_9CLOT|nr:MULTISPECIES: Na+/H+ antiporter subunit E [Caloramator]SHE47401.1 multicomponent Na+:H+ antiporter subunit E [Caloramator proteoclasticus DSM 10124]
MNNFIFTFLSLFLIWSALSYPLTNQEIIFGLILSLFISILTQYYNQRSKSFKIKSLYHLIKYFIVFLIELVKANFNMARIVITPSLPISPKIYEVKTELKSNIAKALLANSITLTPGTISVDLEDDTIYIHVVEGTKVDDVEGLKGPFEKILKEAFE